ncbi:hypothetical protein [Psychrobacillus psychrotolerans]|uniref:hypothetical protein n=1 Tax=Psychrobacillus psychrotolerans TaxID=126156 RepID=UPI003B01F362
MQNEKSFEELLSEFKEQIKEWTNQYRETNLKFVYNQNLDRLENNEIKYILVGDNPGENELNQNKYFVGEAGLIAKWFFKSELNITSFEDEVLILNKTPIHSKTTNDLNDFYPEYLEVMMESQKYMANLIYKLQKILECRIIIVGSGGCRNSGFWDFQAQTNKNQKSLAFFYLEIKSLAQNDRDFAGKLFNFPHFSVMQFPRYLVNNVENVEELNENKIFEIGENYTNEILSSVL